jgi:hypothetical protein
MKTKKKIKLSARNKLNNVIEKDQELTPILNVHKSSNSKNITSESEQDILESTHNEYEELIQKPPPSSITITYMPDNVIEEELYA